MNLMPPNITKVPPGMGDYVDPAFGVKESLIGNLPPMKKLSKQRWWDYSFDFETFFLLPFNQGDATYRRDFLTEWLGDKRKELQGLANALPRSALNPLLQRDYDPIDGEDQKELIDFHCARVRKYLCIPEDLETIAQFSGTSDAASDLTRYAGKARQALERYAKFVAPIKASRHYKEQLVDLEWANNVVHQIEPFMEDLNQVRKLKGQLAYYKLLCTPYNLEFNGKKIPFCRPEFLDAGKEEGEIINAYNPGYFKVDKDNISALNVPNDIVWGKNARATFIHGPNNMGKSVYLRTAALNMHLAMAGLFPFADSARLSLPAELHACFDMGDTLSTGHFLTGAERIKYLAKTIKRGSFVFLDEVGGGTEPQAEREIANGLTNALIKYQVPFFCITHDRGSWLKHRNEQGVRILRPADYDDKKRKFKIWEGVAPRGYGMEKARGLGIDPESIDAAFAKRLGN